MIVPSRRSQSTNRGANHVANRDRRPGQSRRESRATGYRARGPLIRVPARPESRIANRAESRLGLRAGLRAASQPPNHHPSLSTKPYPNRGANHLQNRSRDGSHRDPRDVICAYLHGGNSAKMQRRGELFPCPITSGQRHLANPASVDIQLCEGQCRAPGPCLTQHENDLSTKGVRLTDSNQMITHWKIKTDTGEVQQMFDDLRPSMLKHCETAVVGFCETETKARQTFNAAGVDHPVRAVSQLSGSAASSRGRRESRARASFSTPRFCWTNGRPAASTLPSWCTSGPTSSTSSSPLHRA